MVSGPSRVNESLVKESRPNRLGSSKRSMIGSAILDVFSRSILWGRQVAFPKITSENGLQSQDGVMRNEPGWWSVERKKRNK
ncbi:hypothetical protein GDO78_013621 [Eleutherodactylus coqui]|uniref:Uncharacterized protein n=1 Tax=Eleutherodactylus coqui TaxID=57060 RepID=A0A8J6BC57_ELECQ|nr:hypothetical protein GDO78_013621 [Eleutherodactylus coqui]